MGDSPGFLGPQMEEGSPGPGGPLASYLAGLRIKPLTLLALTGPTRSPGPLPKIPSGAAVARRRSRLFFRPRLTRRATCCLVLPLASPESKSLPSPLPPAPCPSRRNEIAIYARYSCSLDAIGGERVHSATRGYLTSCSCV